MKMSIIKFTLAGLVLLFLSGCRTYEQKVAYYSEFLNLATTKLWQDSVVDLQAPAGTGGSQTAPGDLLIVGSQNACRENRNPHPGCVLFERNVSGQITFELQGNPTTRTCSSSPAPNAVIVRVELSATPDTTSGNPASKGVFSATANLPSWVKDNAFPAVDLETGVVYEAADLSSGLTRVSITNRNNHQNIDGTNIKMLWYRVTAQKCSDPSKYWRTDPREDNEGSLF